MTTLIICLIILVMEILPIGSWLAAQGLRLVVPILFSFVLLATLVLPLLDLDQAFHWYDQVIALVAFVYEWGMFFRRGRTTKKS